MKNLLSKNQTYGLILFVFTLVLPSMVSLKAQIIEIDDVIARQSEEDKNPKVNGVPNSGNKLVSLQSLYTLVFKPFVLSSLRDRDSRFFDKIKKMIDAKKATLTHLHSPSGDKQYSFLKSEPSIIDI